MSAWEAELVSQIAHNGLAMGAVVLVLVLAFVRSFRRDALPEARARWWWFVVGAGAALAGLVSLAALPGEWPFF